ncbi:uncharacterized protein LAESUDRAFT_27063 [Laetiporus sulphureus 93-53]|uniref:Uncharacterized protein n=1 Tax=Laetiporus sulphureus 93-53 TaxID=1314785 RepID=A0A165IGM4_9APHY|nr:uncharacterized protein LAESUDRAFT_27063 [Laetiporus sulphureus 93-53]KZT13045.1 hypothetical protein LAESUDRAFT_27063 [Laetiporus sulphureus 93-53]
MLAEPEPEPEPPEYARVFQPMVETLRSRLQQGSEYILYTQLASQLASEVPWIYKEIGHSSFKKYVLLAHEAEIIQYEDENKLLPKRMVGLHPRLR